MSYVSKYCQDISTICAACSNSKEILSHFELRSGRSRLLFQPFAGELPRKKLLGHSELTGMAERVSNAPMKVSVYPHLWENNTQI